MTDIVNLDIRKNELLDYHNTGTYYNEISDIAYNQCIPIINKYLGQQNKTLVIDIDETLITEWDVMVAYDFGWFDENITECQTRTDFPAFPCMVDLVNYCMTNGIAVNILSSRRQKYETETRALLKNAGYLNFTNLILRPNDDQGTIQDYKIGERQKLVALGYDIILNIGDQQSDLNGGYPGVDKQVLVPNPFYLITYDMVCHVCQG